MLSLIWRFGRNVYVDLGRRSRSSVAEPGFSHLERNPCFWARSKLELNFARFKTKLYELVRNCCTSR